MSENRDFENGRVEIHDDDDKVWPRTRVNAVREDLVLATRRFKICWATEATRDATESTIIK